jgi:UDP-N-acetyl-D-glucosamine dehydrogenase
MSLKVSERYPFLMRVGVVGQGYVGLTITAGSLGAGHQVVGYDLNENLVTQLSAGHSHIEGVSSESLQTGIKSGKYKATSNPADIDGCDVVVIAVPTPLDSKGAPDLSALRSACKSLASSFNSKTLIINESTSFPGTLREVIAPEIEKSGLGHSYAVSPERVDPGNLKFGSKNTPRVVGGLTQEATAKAVDFYRTFCDEVIAVSSPEVAEAAKLFENIFRFINIGLVNEFAQVLSKMGIPVDETLSAAATKPYGFMPFHPNVGIGGHCIPVDPFYLQERAKEFGISSKYIEVSDEINKSMPAFIVDRLESELGKSLNGLSIQVIGVSYKKNISDTRETPAEAVVHILKERGAKVSWHDPLVSQWMGEGSSEVGLGAEIALVLVAHDVLDMSGWNDERVFTINPDPRHPDWTPLMTVAPKSTNR